MARNPNYHSYFQIWLYRQREGEAEALIGFRELVIRRPYSVMLAVRFLDDDPSITTSGTRYRVVVNPLKADYHRYLNRGRQNPEELAYLPDIFFKGKVYIQARLR